VASIGGENVVEFATGGGAFDAQPLGSIEGVSDVRLENGNARMQVNELHRSVPVILSEVKRQGVSLTELRTHSATLEDVFVALTGRHLREE
jgi:ABC-2 type transport system ATP-binding protein